MAHYRKVIVNNVEYMYKVEKHNTYVRGVGLFNNKEWGIKTTFDEIVISPRVVRKMILNDTTPIIFKCMKHNCKTDRLTPDSFESCVHDKIKLVMACQECQHDSYMNT